MIDSLNHYERSIYKRLARFIPEAAVNLSFQIWREAPFRLVISKSRRTKLGDYRKLGNMEEAVITVNENLNPYAFLLTYIHEVAHHRVYLNYGNAVQPHGIEWKSSFQNLMRPFLQSIIFPQEINEILKKHMQNPKASSQSDIRLAHALSQYDNKQEEGITLHELNIGTKFFLEDRVFISVESRRTRVRCKELKSGKYYTVHKLAKVKPIKED